MGDIVALPESVSLGEIAAETGIPARQAHALLRRIVTRGQAKHVARWLLDEEQRQEDGRTRKAEATEAARRRARGERP
jgi:DNA-binding MarR family transcriptional regulator